MIKSKFCCKGKQFLIKKVIILQKIIKDIFIFVITAAFYNYKQILEKNITHFY